jgi:hypothetical protein
MTLNITAFSLTMFRIKTFTITTLRITALNYIEKNDIPNNDTQYNKIQHCDAKNDNTYKLLYIKLKTQDCVFNFYLSECRFAECRGAKKK